MPLLLIYKMFRYLGKISHRNLCIHNILTLGLIRDHDHFFLPHDAISQGVPKPNDALLRRELNEPVSLVVHVDCAPRSLMNA